ncbi:echinoderm microtubule-associated protein-like 1 isoform X3 [Nerophis ophidion]|uniref:echinoderm microtubule-associated protein-like 1 isoform X3 n=1 Tax=Nerophis ophidion TaxID=159077 RepID=UPI002AE018F3|nr:echinoderm microtubule-associated protein-like 1 isoform X3 [Nerophis ophidion]
MDASEMEGESVYLNASRGGGGKRTERLCSREERKRRKKVLEEGPQRHMDYSSSVSSASHDGRSSAASNLDVADRLTYLEQRMQMQEDEIQLLKMTLADVLKRLNISEEHQAAAAATGRRVPCAKGRPVSLALPYRPPIVTSTGASLRKSSTLPSSATGRNYSPTPPRRGVMSPAGSMKDSPCKTHKTPPSSSASTCKTAKEGACISQHTRCRHGDTTFTGLPRMLVTPVACRGQQVKRGISNFKHRASDTVQSDYADLSEPPRKKDWVF